MSTTFVIISQHLWPSVVCELIYYGLFFKKMDLWTNLRTMLSICTQYLFVLAITSSMINMVKRTTCLQTVCGSLEVYQQNVDAHQLLLAKLWLLWSGLQPSAFWTQGAKPKASDVTKQVLVTLMVPSLRFGEIKDVIGNGANVSTLKHAISS